jgi:CRISPR-associated protein Cas1
MAVSDVPDLVPARMLNEFIYCPRLFHLEWVQGEFIDNDDTVSGRSVHRKVDAPAGRLPEPGERAGPVTRSVMLDAPRLGVIARIDIIEGHPDGVTPVERKRGRPRKDGGVWEPEELQVVAQAMVLRENGYRVTHGVVSYPHARARIDVEITPEREARVREYIARLKVAAAGPCPPPLVDSPKCPRCSLVGICLPDETHLLRDEAASASARRMVAPRDDAQPLYVQEQGARIGLRRGRVEVTKDDELLASVRPIDVAHVSVYGNISVSAPALRAFCGADVPVTHHTYAGWLTGVTTGPGHRNAELRIAQFAAAADTEASLAIARAMIDGKIRNQRTMIRRNARGDPRECLSQLSRMARRSRVAGSAGELLGVEGSAARSYFGVFGAMLVAGSGGDAFTLEGRNRRPPRDPVNALLSFAYSLLVRETIAAVIRVGLDPYVGIFHRPRYGRPALGLDIAEEFRPLVADSVVVGFINNGQASPGDFIVRGGAYALSEPAGRDFIAAFERRMSTEIRHPIFGYPASYRRIVELQARLLARVLVGELDAYPPFVTR